MNGKIFLKKKKQQKVSKIFIFYITLHILEDSRNIEKRILKYLDEAQGFIFYYKKLNML